MNKKYKYLILSIFISILFIPTIKIKALGTDKSDMYFSVLEENFNNDFIKYENLEDNIGDNNNIKIAWNYLKNSLNMNDTYMLDNFYYLIITRLEDNNTWNMKGYRWPKNEDTFYYPIGLRVSNFYATGARQYSIWAEINYFGVKGNNLYTGSQKNNNISQNPTISKINQSSSTNYKQIASLIKGDYNNSANYIINNGNIDMYNQNFVKHIIDTNYDIPFYSDINIDTPIFEPYYTSTSTYKYFQIRNNGEIKNYESGDILISTEPPIPNYLNGYTKKKLGPGERYFVISDIQEGSVYISKNCFDNYFSRIFYKDSTLNYMPSNAYILEGENTPDNLYVKQNFNLTSYNGANLITFQKYDYIEGTDNITCELWYPSLSYGSDMIITPNGNSGNNFEYEYRDSQGNIQEEIQIGTIPNGSQNIFSNINYFFSKSNKNAIINTFSQVWENIEGNIKSYLMIILSGSLIIYLIKIFRR